MNHSFEIEMAISMIRSARESVRYAFEVCEAAEIQFPKAEQSELFKQLDAFEQAFQAELNRARDDQH